MDSLYATCRRVVWCGCGCKEQPPKNWSLDLLLKVQGMCKQTKTQSQLALWKIAGKVLEMLERF